MEEESSRRGKYFSAVVWIFFLSRSSGDHLALALIRELWGNNLIWWFWSQTCCCLVAQSCSTLWDPMNCSTPDFPVFHYLLEFAQTNVHWVGGAIQPSHSLSSPSPPSLNLPHHQGLFQWVGSLYQVTKVLELQFQHQSFQWIFKIDFL